MRNLVALLVHVPLREQLRRIIVGMRAPKESGEYKYARLALLRMFGPSVVALLGSVSIALGALMVRFDDDDYTDTSYAVELVVPSSTKLDSLKIEEDKPEEFKASEPMVKDVVIRIFPRLPFLKSERRVRPRSFRAIPIRPVKGMVLAAT